MLIFLLNHLAEMNLKHSISLKLNIMEHFLIKKWMEHMKMVIWLQEITLAASTFQIEAYFDIIDKLTNQFQEEKDYLILVKVKQHLQNLVLLRIIL